MHEPTPRGEETGSRWAGLKQFFLRSGFSCLGHQQAAAAGVPAWRMRTHPVMEEAGAPSVSSVLGLVAMRSLTISKNAGGAAVLHTLPCPFLSLPRSSSFPFRTPRCPSAAPSDPPASVYNTPPTPYHHHHHSLSYTGPTPASQLAPDRRGV